MEDPRQDPPNPEFFGALRKRRKTQPEAKKRQKRKPRPPPVQAANPEPEAVVIDLGSDDDMGIHHETHDAESDADSVFVAGETLWLNYTSYKGLVIPLSLSLGHFFIDCLFDFIFSVDTYPCCSSCCWFVPMKRVFSDTGNYTTNSNSNSFQTSS
jgi:hypothetical protein